jgi:hypothetical protein
VLKHNNIEYRQYDIAILVTNLGNVDYTKQGRLYADAEPTGVAQ